SIARTAVSLAESRVSIALRIPYSATRRASSADLGSLARVAVVNDAVASVRRSPAPCDEGDVRRNVGSPIATNRVAFRDAGSARDIRATVADGTSEIANRSIA